MPTNACRYCDSDRRLGFRRLCITHAHETGQALLAVAREALALLGSVAYVAKPGDADNLVERLSVAIAKAEGK